MTNGHKQGTQTKTDLSRIEDTICLLTTDIATRALAIFINGTSRARRTKHQSEKMKLKFLADIVEYSRSCTKEIKWHETIPIFDLK
jgi:hypothetical protein